MKRTSFIETVTKALYGETDRDDRVFLVIEEAFYYLNAPVMRVCGHDIPAIHFSPPMGCFFHPIAEKIANAAKKIMEY
jgi:pyruvate/2-oxoglutarate/acetoin dehydrogenase E1 component